MVVGYALHSPLVYGLHFFFSREEEYSRILIHFTFNIYFKQVRQMMHFKITISSPYQSPEFQTCIFMYTHASQSLWVRSMGILSSSLGSLPDLQSNCPPGLHLSRSWWSISKLTCMVVRFSSSLIAGTQFLAQFFATLHGATKNGCYVP